MLQATSKTKSDESFKGRTEWGVAETESKASRSKGKIELIDVK